MGKTATIRVNDRFGDDCRPAVAQSNTDVQKSLQRIASQHGLVVITAKEQKYYQEVLRSLKRAKRIIDSFNVAFFGKSERSIDQVIQDLQNYTYEVNGTRQSRISMLLAELKALRNQGKECNHEGRESESEAGESPEETPEQSTVFQEAQGKTATTAADQRSCPSDRLEPLNIN